MGSAAVFPLQLQPTGSSCHPGMRAPPQAQRLSGAPGAWQRQRLALGVPVGRCSGRHLRRGCPCGAAGACGRGGGVRGAPGVFQLGHARDAVSLLIAGALGQYPALHAPSLPASLAPTPLSHTQPTTSTQGCTAARRMWRWSGPWAPSPLTTGWAAKWLCGCVVRRGRASACRPAAPAPLRHAASPCLPCISPAPLPPCLMPPWRSVPPLYHPLPPTSTQATWTAAPSSGRTQTGGRWSSACGGVRAPCSAATARRLASQSQRAPQLPGAAGSTPGSPPPPPPPPCAPSTCRDFRPSWQLNVTEPVAGNFYPLTAAVTVQDSTRQLTVLTERAQGEVTGGEGLRSGQQAERAWREGHGGP